MTPAGFSDWKRYHCSLLCIHHQDYDQMCKDMEPIFLKMKATVEEMDAASLWLWEHPDMVERPWGTHGGMIRSHIMRQRREREAARERERRRKEDAEYRDKPPVDWRKGLAEKFTMPKE